MPTIKDAPLTIAVFVVEHGYQIEIRLNDKLIYSGCRDFADERQPEQVYWQIIQGVQALMEALGNV